MEEFIISKENCSLDKILDYIYALERFGKHPTIFHDEKVQASVQLSQKTLEKVLEKKVPIYGVNTGFGDSCHRIIDQNNDELQKNLLEYLCCGTGKILDEDVSRAILLLRLISLSKGFSGVSNELLNYFNIFLNKNWIPCIAQEGSLGASGDLIPLSYIGQCIQGKGEVFANGEKLEISSLMLKHDLVPYQLKVKEGLAIVNGTSAMTAIAVVNLNHINFLIELSTLCSAWACLVLGGRKEAFNSTVNAKAKKFKGQTKIAQEITSYLEQENFQSVPLEQIAIDKLQTMSLIQDPYSLRCVPQILGPILETYNMVTDWMELEINGVSDNPLFDTEDNSISNGGNFYGGYIAHGMDYLKICLGNMADMSDRQLALIINEKTNRGLTPNLANWNELADQEKHLHHGLKGLHQLVSAITSEIMQKTTPNSIFSRSSESHNQDKVSLGFSAAIQCSQIIDSSYNLIAAYLVCLIQAIDLRKITLKGKTSNHIYQLTREHVAFVTRDRRLDKDLLNLTNALKTHAKKFTSIKQAE